ncbi:hypothetical protein DR950_23645 [Kitasatospora xanthocidica]|uniref:Lipoprotein n=1 Tax=Kitasatospora xanthocidica TaxID=83382 RepID=A0A372ZX09_9ACTN|nr:MULTISPECIES: hypothetical protein [Streptomycetaceae]OKI08612.1 hypothetical protein AMK13_08995 [Streptomyces sp. CB02056]RGD60383.1 hypothetical protein DR950_23645 [Kitasatospora xanthocidica]
MDRRTRTGYGPVVLVVAALLSLAGCADAMDAAPEDRTFEFAAQRLNVVSHGAPADLVAVDRKDVKVTRWFETSGKVGSAKASWELKDGVLDLRAGCSGIANCDTKYRVEVPKGVAVLRDGRETELKG